MALMDERRTVGNRQKQEREQKTLSSRQRNDISPSALMSAKDKKAGPCRLRIGMHEVRLPAPPPPMALVAYEQSKRAADVVMASLLLTLLFPIFISVALAIYLEDQGKIFYYQTRVGRNGVHFRFYKFRSMVPNADQLKEKLAAQNEAGDNIFKMKNDPRITRVGRFIRRASIDELPQLINVLRGEMSLVGPRPHLPREVAQYSGCQSERLSVQPGLLCLREVFGRSNMTFEQWVALDLLYIKHRCILTDVMILMRAVPAIIKGEGAY